MPDIVHRWLLVPLTCVPLACIAQGDSESIKQSAAKMLPSLWTAMEMDDKCNTLDYREKQALRASISSSAEMLKISEEALRTKMAEANPAKHLQCSDPLAQSLLKMAKVVAQAWMPKSASAAPEEPVEEDQNGPSWNDIQRSWSDIFKKTPRGQLGIVEGCWHGSFDKLAAEICFLERGDLVRFRLGPPSAPHCSFSDGGGRYRQERAWFFAAAKEQRCSDGSRIQHVEGACQPISDMELECMISIYSEGAWAYKTSADETVSGTLRMRKR
jgi:hypothetical protein